MKDKINLPRIEELLREKRKELSEEEIQTKLRKYKEKLDSEFKSEDDYFRELELARKKDKRRTLIVMLLALLVVIILISLGIY